VEDTRPTVSRLVVTLQSVILLHDLGHIKSSQTHRHPAFVIVLAIEKVYTLGLVDDFVLTLLDLLFPDDYEHRTTRTAGTGVAVDQEVVGLEQLLLHTGFLLL